MAESVEKLKGWGFGVFHGFSLGSIQVEPLYSVGPYGGGWHVEITLAFIRLWLMVTRSPVQYEPIAAEVVSCVVPPLSAAAHAFEASDEAASSSSDRTIRFSIPMLRQEYTLPFEAVSALLPIYAKLPSLVESLNGSEKELALMELSSGERVVVIIRVMAATKGQEDWQEEFPTAP